MYIIYNQTFTTKKKTNIMQTSASVMYLLKQDVAAVGIKAYLTNTR